MLASQWQIFLVAVAIVHTLKTQAGQNPLFCIRCTSSFFTAPNTSSIHKMTWDSSSSTQSMPIVLTTIEIERSSFSRTCKPQNPSWKQPHTQNSQHRTVPRFAKKLQILSEIAFQWKLWKQLNKIPSLCIKHTENFTTPNSSSIHKRLQNFPVIASQCYYSLL